MPSEPLPAFDPERFRREGRAVVDWIADYWHDVAEKPVQSSVKPGWVRAQLPPHPPEQPEPLDAVLTYHLVVSIFQLKSPLHDGAIIVREDRVAAAACFLPLTVNPKLSTELGSRHRAAIGLTEENDSIAIVVSEETGSISLVVDGQIERGITADDLRSRLREIVINRATRGRRRMKAA